MAERRMFAKDVVRSDRFLSMSASSRELYFQLGMETDDEGFVSSPLAVMRVCSAVRSDMETLINNGFVIPFESGVVLVRHHWLNNTFRSLRRHGTVNVREAEEVVLGDDKVWSLRSGDVPAVLPIGPSLDQGGTNDGPSLDQGGTTTVQKAPLKELNRTELNLTEQNRTEKSVRASKKPTHRASFVPPTVEQVRDHCREKGYTFSPEQFVAYYETRGWKTSSGTPVKSWESACVTWQGRQPGGMRAAEDRLANAEYYDPRESITLDELMARPVVADA